MVLILRYYLIKEVSFGNDGNISQEKLENCINSDLANNYGNLCQRVMAFIDKNLGSVIPDKIEFTKEDLAILDNFSNSYQNLLDYIDDQDINSYINYILERLFAANKYFNDEEPWKKKDKIIRLNTIIYVSLELIRKITILLYPIIPDSTIKVLNVFEIKENEIDFKSIKKNNYLKSGKKLNNMSILFKKIEKND